VPCPKGYKHSKIHPRPNRQRSLVGKRSANIPDPQITEATAKGKEADPFTVTDEIWLQAIGICL